MPEETVKEKTTVAFEETTRTASGTVKEQDVTITKDRTLTRHLTPEISPHTAQVVWRDVLLIALGCVAVSIIGFVETHAMDAEKRTIGVHIAGLFHTHDMPLNPHGIVDTGFIMTYPLYEVLKENRDLND